MIIKTCSICGVKIGSNSRHGICLSCYQSQYRKLHNTTINQRVSVWKKEYRQTHREQIRDYARYERFRLKLETIEAYGGQCVCCGEKEPLFLTIDHINGDGKQDRDLGHTTGTGFYRYLRKVGWPKDRYRLLCFNCNTARGFWGVCPHELSKTPDHDALLEGQASFRLWLSQGVGRPHRRWRTAEELNLLWQTAGLNPREQVNVSQLMHEDSVYLGMYGYHVPLNVS
jgi:hypothetical protein